MNLLYSFSCNFKCLCSFYAQFVLNCILGHSKGTWCLRKRFEVYLEPLWALMKAFESPAGSHALVYRRYNVAEQEYQLRMPHISPCGLYAPIWSPHALDKRACGHMVPSCEWQGAIQRPCTSMEPTQVFKFCWFEYFSFHAASMHSHACLHDLKL